MMQYATAERRRVFLAYRALFAGERAMLRKSKKVREVVEKHKSSFQPLIREFGNDKIIGILKELLAGRIFQSELRAKVEFPELFRSSPARDVQRTTSENDAARSEAEALEWTMQPKMQLLWRLWLVSTVSSSSLLKGDSKTLRSLDVR
jgi:hypothetical protein